MNISKWGMLVEVYKGSVGIMCESGRLQLTGWGGGGGDYNMTELCKYILLKCYDIKNVKSLIDLTIFLWTGLGMANQKKNQKNFLFSRFKKI